MSCPTLDCLSPLMETLSAVGQLKKMKKRSLSRYPGTLGNCYNAFSETGATQTMKTNQMAELKQ